MTAFSKTLTRNDTGANGSHQAGILVPKGDRELLTFFPPLDPAIKNPDRLIDCRDETGKWWRFRYVYYNNKLHDPDGTRNEYRITRMTAYFRSVGAREGQSVVFENRSDGSFEIRLHADSPERPTVTKLSGWRRIH
ncbi:EcoRII N-terminal effector-binding domain-containing protein [Parerythrobacter jejuensis]|uniref:Restriction endonuclease n=1 Tax=Parerythrobacter jejuensis TaxID=795812 RepID=A0A845B369_9SPHN|nr:EcoRII N-terminal effector-binding domain-containing protein [Parerythrobacter jejuensis]MXP30648.1 restriction endonuclease [Parerythrobacter jejuensis]MXP33408.1 restriction endonuclease [Parerythrobacter jejuensis]